MSSNETSEINKIVAAEERLEKVLIGVAAGAAGLLAGFSIGPLQDTSSNDKAAIIQEGNQGIIRTYENRRRDHIYVEYPENSKSYVTMDKYLELEKTRNEAEIKKRAGWDD